MKENHDEPNTDGLAHGAGVDAQLNEIDQLLQQAPSPDEPGAPAGEAAAPDIDAAEAVTSLVDMAFQILAFRCGKHWLLQKKEAELLGNASAAVLAKYASSVTLGPEVALVMVTGMIVGPRLMQQLQQAKPSEKEDSGDKRKSVAA